MTKPGFRSLPRGAREALASALGEVAAGDAASGARLLAELPAGELERIVDAAIEETGATGMKDMGAVMGRAVALAGGRAQGGELAPLVRGRLQ